MNVRPFECKFEYRINVFNELIMIMVVYLLKCVAVSIDNSIKIGDLMVIVI